MKNKKIICMAVNFTGIKGRNKVRDWEVTSEGKVWPCCFFANAWDKRHMKLNDTIRKNLESDALFEDPKFRNYIIKHPDFNDLSKRSMDDIISDELYNTYIWHEGWESENPPRICVKECSVKIDTTTGEEVSNANIRAQSSRNNDK